MSLKKIATMTGVSTSTVSRVLNNPDYHCTDEKIREKIWKVAMEQEYVPNEAARNLKKGGDTPRKTYYINILMVENESSQIDSIYSEILRVIESEIHKQLCILTNIWIEPNLANNKKCGFDSLDKIIGNLYNSCEGKADGLIVIGAYNTNALKILGKYFKNIISLNRDGVHHEIDEVTCDGNKIAQIAVEYLIANGHTHIGYVGPCHNEVRYNGFVECMNKHNMVVNPNFVIETVKSEKDGYEAMAKFLTMDESPTAIYASNDIIAIGLLKYLNRRKNPYFRPSIISCDDIEQAQFTKPMLTTVRLPKEELGKFTVELLIDRIKSGHSSIVSMELEGKLVKRESCTNVEDTYFNYYI